MQWVNTGERYYGGYTTDSESKWPVVVARLT